MIYLRASITSASFSLFLLEVHLHHHPDDSDASRGSLSPSGCIKPLLGLNLCKHVNNPPLIVVPLISPCVFSPRLQNAISVAHAIVNAGVDEPPSVLLQAT